MTLNSWEQEREEGTLPEAVVSIKHSMISPFETRKSSCVTARGVPPLGGGRKGYP